MADELKAYYEQPQAGYVTVELGRYESLMEHEARYFILRNALFDAAELTYNHKNMNFDYTRVGAVLQAVDRLGFKGRFDELIKEYEASVAASKEGNYGQDKT